MANEKRLTFRDEWGDARLKLGILICEAVTRLARYEDGDFERVVHGLWEYGKWENGHWVKGNERCRCSVCHRDFAVDNLNIWHGCPQCLAKMDGDGNG